MWLWILFFKHSIFFFFLNIQNPANNICKCQASKTSEAIDTEVQSPADMYSDDFQTKGE